MYKSVILLILLIGSVSTQQCSSSNPLDLIQTGTHNFQVAASSNPIRTYDVTIGYSIPPNGIQVATSTSLIAGFNSAGGFEFTLQGRRKFGNQNILQITLDIANGANWNVIQAAYFVTSRTDFTVGSVLVEVFDWEYQADGSVLAYPFIQNSNIVNQNYEIVVFFSGIFTDARAYDLKILEDSFIIDPQTIAIHFLPRAEFDEITFSYIIYPASHPNFQFTVSQPPPTNGAYRIAGVSHFKRSGLEYFGLAISNGGIPCLGSGCPSSCIQESLCVSNGGAVFQGTCYICGAGQVFQSGSCQSQCGPNQFWSNNACICVPNAALYQGNCRLCPPNSIPNVAQTSCVCSSQTAIYVPSSNICSECPVNSFSNGAVCTCIPGYQMVSGQCVNLCGPNQVWENNECVCTVGYIWYQINCRPCPPNSLVSADKLTCICTSAFEIYEPTINNCIPCGANSVPNQDKSACICIPFHSSTNGGPCEPNCPPNQYYVSAQVGCACNPGFQLSGGNCIEKCGANEIWNNGACVCIAGNVRYNGACRPCPPTSVPSQDLSTCVCNSPSQIFNPNSNSCDQCPANSAPNANKDDCVCVPGYHEEQGFCVADIVCQANAIVVNNQCVCKQNYYNDNDVCKKTPQCPTNAVFDQRRLVCKCTIPGQNLIGRSCRACGDNQIFNDGRCVCDEGFYKIFGRCRTCDPRSTYENGDCVCNHGYYGNRDLCEPCHQSCGTCSGPGAEQCMTCIDISFVFENGFCTKPICSPGTFLENGVCQKCTDFCNNCSNIYTCDECAEGYEIISQNLDGLDVSFCTQICGDGRSFESPCDDGNTDNGDGCSDTCAVEDDWTCFGITSAAASTCLELIPENSVIQVTGAVATAGKVYQQIRMSFIPECARQFDCAQCHQILEVRVIDSLVKAIGVKVAYKPNSFYQFYAQFDFGSAFVSSIFTFVVQINENFRGCFSDEDMNQQVKWYVDPSSLALGDETQTLGNILELTDEQTAAAQEAERKAREARELKADISELFP